MSGKYPFNYLGIYIDVKFSKMVKIYVVTIIVPLKTQNLIQCT